MRTVLTETVDQTQVGSHPEARGVSPSRNLNYVIPLAVVGLASVACTPSAPESPSVLDLGNGTYKLPSGNIIDEKGNVIWDATAQRGGVSQTPTPGVQSGVTAEPTAGSPTPGPAARTEATPTPENKTLPPFAIYGVQGTLSFEKNDPILPNNGPDSEGNDHKTQHLPTNPVSADPGHYRVDNITNVTDPATRATIERDVRNGAAYAGDDYKDVLNDENTEVPLMESGGAAMITTDHAELSFTDASGNTVTIQCGSKPKNGYVIVVQNGLARDQVKDTDANRTLRVSKYDTAWTMWQGIPPGKFVSDMFISQTTADVHGTYKDRGTSPGAGHDGHTLATIVLVKILPEGVAYQVFEHDSLQPWQEYKPSDFKQVAGNVVIQ